MVVPESEQRLQQIGPAQERAVGGFRRAHNHVVAAAGADVAAVEHEFFRRQPDLARLLVQFLAALNDLRPSFDAGCTLTSITPGSGVTEKCSRPGSRGGR